MKVKVCGITRTEDAVLAVSLGATHIGCIRASDSPRSASDRQIGDVFDAVGSSAKTVLVTRGLSPVEIERDAHRLSPDLVQPHGLSAADLESFAARGIPFIRVHRIEQGATCLPALEPMPSEGNEALLDVGGGGGGHRFDWSLLEPWSLASGLPHGLFLAGGIHPDNAGDLCRFLPYGIDLSSGVESAPGIKDPEKLERFFSIVERFR